MYMYINVVDAFKTFFYNIHVTPDYKASEIPSPKMCFLANNLDIISIIHNF